MHDNHYALNHGRELIWKWHFETDLMKPLRLESGDATLYNCVKARCARTTLRHQCYTLYYRDAQRLKRTFNNGRLGQTYRNERWDQNIIKKNPVWPDRFCWKRVIVNRLQPPEIRVFQFLVGNEIWRVNQFHRDEKAQKVIYCSTQMLQGMA